VIIHNLYPIRVAVLPYKTQPPLIVDANAVLVLPIAFQSLQSVSRQSAQSVKSLGGIQHVEFSERRSLNGSKTLHRFALKKALGVRVPEGLDHIGRVYWNALNVNR
jgi:hypothetical protein